MDDSDAIVALSLMVGDEVELRGACFVVERRCWAFVDPSGPKACGLRPRTLTITLGPRRGNWLGHSPDCSWHEGCLCDCRYKERG